MKPALPTLLAHLLRRARAAGSRLVARAGQARRPRWALALRGFSSRWRELARGVPRIESLKVKLAVGFALVASLILITTYAALSAAARRVAAEEARKRASQLSNYFSGIFSESVAAQDRMQVHLLSRALLSQEIKALSVVDTQGKVLFSSHPELQEEALYAAAELEVLDRVILGTTTTGGEQFFHAVAPIRFGTSPVGMVHLWLAKTDLEASIQAVHAFIYPIFALGFVLMACLGTVALQSPFRALRRLTAAARQVEQGDLSGRVPVQGRDEVAAFSRAFNAMVGGLQQARNEILRRHLEVIQAMISVMEAKDSYTQGHCARVKNYAATILDKFKGFPPEERTLIETAALLHDIGKIGIPDGVLLKEGRLGKKELSIIRNHVLIGERILLHVDSMRQVARWVRHHHERWDGLGYPDGLRGEAIPFASRVIAVADVIDALLTDRPYRKALSREEAIATLREGRGTQFDPAIIDCAITFLEVEDREKASVHA
jgi:putative nucleotidyltransferase with HDIG domain